MKIRVAVCATALCVATLAAADDKHAALDQALSRVASYLARYESQLSTVVAEEHYEQESKDSDIAAAPLPEKRVLDSDFLFLRLPGGNAWLGLRDTFRVNGKDARSSDAGVLQDLRAGRATLADAFRIADENGRRNLGSLLRMVDVPTMTLDVFAAENQPRFRFSKSGEERTRGRVSWIISFSEIARPTLIRTAEGADERTRGRVWIDPQTGAVQRTVMDFGDGGPDDEFVQSRITVVYASEPTLGFPVPVDMVEYYYRPRSSDYTELRISGHATYSHFRRFDVSAGIIQPQESR